MTNEATLLTGSHPNVTKRKDSKFLSLFADNDTNV